jgi:excisionase family DNA binding protein
MTSNLELSQQITCSPAQACALLSVGKTALYALLGDGSIRSIKHGKARLIIVASLYEWVAAMESFGFGSELQGGSK